MSEKSAREAERTDAVRPRRVAVAAAVCGAQGAVLAGVAAVMLVLAVGGEPGDRAQAVAGALTLLALAVVPLVAGHGLWRLRRWSRGPGVMAQLLALPIAFTLLGSGGAWVGAALPLAASALLVLGCLLSPTATEALGVGPGRA
ncbi:hypothetical protein RM844_04890 [Streptomyces sp. DSM 44915]|uniref:Integral membrane protein n=1 Tax=Streptomyces chisholmiae TaxID=3075540 RepID=A0ABU2JM71_9ACTN|nr:hypothetical protein [Streptomyces sp. DSM 44915]MDT0265624.1 hypothetical protein [Streptomyces sp. DSM 44915]